MWDSCNYKTSFKIADGRKYWKNSHSNQIYTINIDQVLSKHSIFEFEGDHENNC